MIVSRPRLRDPRPAGAKALCMLSLTDDARAADGHAAWSPSLAELFALVAGMFRERGGTVPRREAGYMQAVRGGIQYLQLKLTRV
jgi:hypothetical protein